ncbi:MAG: GatB/YqeY domain-containing protein [Lautropia sp.]|nr:GatB/YqeY domain-containing protein [Lautropia sp.]
MRLKERITEDMKTAMRARDSARLSTIRLLLAAIKQKEVDERIAVDDAQALAIIEKLIKQRRDSIEQFQRANRQDLVDQETFELSVLASYQPEQADAGELAAAVAQAIDFVQASGAAGPAAMGKVMAVLKSKLAGRADMSSISALVKAGLSARGAK